MGDARVQLDAIKTARSSASSAACQFRNAVDKGRRHVEQMREYTANILQDRERKTQLAQAEVANLLQRLKEAKGEEAERLCRVLANAQEKLARASEALGEARAAHGAMQGLAESYQALANQAGGKVDGIVSGAKSFLDESERLIQGYVSGFPAPPAPTSPPPPKNDGPKRGGIER